MKKLFTSESVTEGHPDKICDQISDAILDEILRQDPYGRVAAETTVNTGYAMVMGEISTSCYVDIPSIVRRVITDIGYDRAKYGFDGETCAVMTSIDEQSPDIAMGVNKALEYREEAAKDGVDPKEGSKDGLKENSKNNPKVELKTEKDLPEEDSKKELKKDPLDEIGAGDQGLMFGFACNETPEYLPMPIALAHKLARQLAKVRKDKTLPFLRPDGKTQVTVEYDGDKVKRIDTILISTQHDPDVTMEEIRSGLLQHVIRPVVDPALMDEKTRILINPTGRFVIGGPKGDSGLTGRKIIVDTYGGYARHGGGAFSGKDPTKVDRSAAYAARYAAKNLVAAGLADKCELQLAYAIGVARPVSVFVDSFGTGKLPDEKLAEIVMKHFDLRPAAIIRDLDLRRPIYRQTAAYGHFGRTDIDLPWERLDKSDALRAELELNNA